MMSRERDMAFGRHSRLPECCIQFFVDGRWDVERDRGSAYREAVHLSDYDYVPCPPCFATNTKVKMLDCAEYCGMPCYKIFDAEYPQ